MEDVSGNLQSSFSQDYLNLQKGFCCDTGNLKLIRWNGCKPAIYKGSKNLFTSDDLALCSWFHSINNYSFFTVDLSKGEFSELEVQDTQYIMMKCLWEENSLTSQKFLEVGINKQPGVIGSTIPFPIGVPDPVDYNYTLLRDLFISNTSSIFGGKIKLNNCSPYQVSVSIMLAY
jgi:hypothetical protein